MSRQGKLLVVALVTGVWLLVMIHGVSYWSARNRLTSSQGQGTMTGRTVEQVRRSHLIKGFTHVGLWTGGICLAKLALVIAAKETAEPKGTGGGDPPDGATPSQ